MINWANMFRGMFDGSITYVRLVIVNEIQEVYDRYYGTLEWCETVYRQKGNTWEKQWRYDNNGDEIVCFLDGYGPLEDIVWDEWESKEMSIDEVINDICEDLLNLACCCILEDEINYY